MLITDEMATGKPIIKHQILTYLANWIDLFNLWKWYMAFFICRSNRYLCTLHTPINRIVNI